MTAPALIFAPLGDDARAIAAEVAACGHAAEICAGAEDLVQLVRDGGPEAALLCIVSQEGAGPETGKALAEVFAAEPEWAKLPLIFLVADARRPPPAVRLLDRRENVPPFLVLGRPCRPAVLRHAIETQAEARRRQYDMRDLLEKLRSEEQRSRFLLSELRHRTRNSLAVLQAIFTMSARNARTIDELTTSFGDRLETLSAANGRLSEEGTGWVALSELLKEHVEPYATGPGQLRLSDPEVLLDENTAFDFAMIVHELATNAAKYGALSRAEGRVEVDWGLEPEANLLRLTWRERGGPPVSPPARQGLGSRLIGDFAPAGRKAQIAFEAEGLVWTGWIHDDGHSLT